MKTSGAKVGGMKAAIPKEGRPMDEERAPEDGVLEQVHALMHEYRAMQYRGLRDGPVPLTHLDGKVLGFFARHAGATLSDLAAHSGRDKAQLAKLVKGLREQGLLQGDVDAVDRRNVRLSLTAEGKAVHRTVRDQARRLSGKAMSGFSATEEEQLMALLARVRRNLAD